MVKKIIWTHKADYIFKKILEYYADRNNSNTYSRKLNNEIHSLVKILAKQPFIGLKTDDEHIRVFIHHDYKIFYQIDDELRHPHFFHCNDSDIMMSYLFTSSAISTV